VNSLNDDATTTTTLTSIISTRASPKKGKRKKDAVGSLTDTMKNIVTMCASNSVMCVSNTIPSGVAVANTKDDLLSENHPQK